LRKRIPLLFALLFLAVLIAFSLLRKVTMPFPADTVVPQTPTPGIVAPATDTVIPQTPTPDTFAPPTNTVIPQTPTPRTMDALCPMLLTPKPQPEKGLLLGPTEQKCNSQPHVRVCSSAINLHVGETFRVEGQAVQIGMPIYALHAHENGTSGFGSSWEIREGGQIFSSSETSRVLKLISAGVEQSTASFTLQALATGVVEVNISATGEIGCEGGPWFMAGGGSDVILITVTK
jgi:hypothetical protein